MSDLLSITSGWTGLLGPFTLRVDGVPLNLTGFTVDLIIHDSLGNLLTLGGSIEVLDQTLHPGQVTYQPISTDFIFSSKGATYRQAFTIHWKVTDGANKVVYFPNTSADEIGVYKS